MAEQYTREAREAMIAQVEKEATPKYGARNAGKYAVDCWMIHTGKMPKPSGWKDPYAKLDKAAKPKPKATKAKAKK